MRRPGHNEQARRAVGLPGSKPLNALAWSSQQVLVTGSHCSVFWAQHAAPHAKLEFAQHLLLLALQNCGGGGRQRGSARVKRNTAGTKS